MWQRTVVADLSSAALRNNPGVIGLHYLVLISSQPCGLPFFLSSKRLSCLRFQVFGEALATFMAWLTTYGVVCEGASKSRVIAALNQTTILE